MLFPDDELFEYVLIDFANEIAARPVPTVNPLPCDRWIARSALQKAIRRAEPVIAIRALANLFEYDNRSVWRHLTIIGLEDVGVGNIDVLARIIAAQRARMWRKKAGGDWAVFAELVRQMALSNHCQAACDLLLRATNDPSHQPFREEALEGDIGDLVAQLADGSQPIVQRGISALAAGGCLADGQLLRDPAAVFEALAYSGSFSHVVTTCRSAWKITRNPMALLLPIIWQSQTTEENSPIADDAMPPVQLTSGVPGYALDQFTRRGNAVSRAFLAACPEMKSALEAASIRSGQQASIVGDLIFLVEGGRVRNRLEWPIGDRLRLPYRWLPAVGRLGYHIDQCLSLIEANVSQIATLRGRSLSSGLD